MSDIREAYDELKEALNEGFSETQDRPMPSELDKTTLIGIKRMLTPLHKILYGEFDNGFKNASEWRDKCEDAVFEHEKRYESKPDEYDKDYNTPRLRRAYKIAEARWNLWRTAYKPLEDIYISLAGGSVDSFDPDNPYWIGDRPTETKELPAVVEDEVVKDAGVVNPGTDNEVFQINGKEYTREEFEARYKKASGETTVVKGKKVSDAQETDDVPDLPEFLDRTKDAKDTKDSDVEDDVVVVDDEDDPNVPFDIEKDQERALIETT